MKFDTMTSRKNMEPMGPVPTGKPISEQKEASAPAPSTTPCVRECGDGLGSPKTERLENDPNEQRSMTPTAPKQLEKTVMI